jgi:hypothetical protein
MPPTDMKLDSRLKTIQVSCYSGYKANERPTQFTFRSRKLRVLELLDSWYGINHSYFKVLADDNKAYLIRYDHDNDRWTMEKILGLQRG